MVGIAVERQRRTRTKFADAPFGGLRDRQFLANDGFLNVVVVLDSESGELIGGPEFLSRGCFYMDSADELLAEAATVVEGRRTGLR